MADPFSLLVSSFILLQTKEEYLDKYEWKKNGKCHIHFKIKQNIVSK